MKRIPILVANIVGIAVLLLAELHYSQNICGWLAQRSIMPGRICETWRFVATASLPSCLALMVAGIVFSLVGLRKGPQEAWKRWLWTVVAGVWLFVGAMLVSAVI
jgi:hypothetical protein